jgi:hypothetical protein
VKRVIGATISGGGFLSALAAAGWTGAVVLISVTALLVAALCWVVCWVVNDAGRAQRLNLLLRTWLSRR